MNEILKVEALEKEFVMGPSRISVLRGIDLSLKPSEIVAVVGASGVGKTTLLHILGALDQPSSGKIYFQGEDLSQKDPYSLALFRNQTVGFIFQFHYLLPEFTAVENVAMPIRMRGESKQKAEGLAKDRLNEVELSHRYTHRPTELSGGEQQRVAIARALIGNPSLILADEPTGSLDLETGRKVTDLLFKVVKEQGRSLIVATHNPEVARRADRILKMREGRLFVGDAV